MIMDMNDKDNSNKRKRKKGDNPLSHARGKQKKPENVWFRRSKAGYSLFVQYYQGQPNGTVCSCNVGNVDNVDDETSTKPKSKSKSKSKPNNGGGGMSRAAKRRNKKKKQSTNTNTNTNTNTSSSTTPTNETDMTTNTTTTTKEDATVSIPTNIIHDSIENENHPLFQALSKVNARSQSQSQPEDFQSQFRSFLQTMSRPLPLSFRLRQTASQEQLDKAQLFLSQPKVSSLVQRIFFENKSNSSNGEGNDNSNSHSKNDSTNNKNFMIYQARPGSNLSKSSFSNRNTHLKFFKEFLVDQSQNGTLARQEIGSMLPVLALALLRTNSSSTSTSRRRRNSSGEEDMEEEDADGKKNGNNSNYCPLQDSSRVVDMCASPGSKTLQALELVGEFGRVIANDVSEARLETLQQALGRSGVSQELLSRITYTCQDGTKLKPPSFQRKSSTSTSATSPLGWNAVLCDVPCSGDGTCRKDKHILPMWKPNYGNDLHSVQLGILMRALELVQIGGMVCYSTCSLNPIEDEAVVAAALLKYANVSKVSKSKNSKIKNDDDDDDDDDNSSSSPRIELVDWPNLPGFIRRPGISTWKVADYKDDEASSSANIAPTNNEKEENDEEEDEETPRLRWHDTWQEAKTAKMEAAVETMWPPPKVEASSSSSSSSNNGKDLHLERCTRLWPQDQDTGGFFLALFRKNW